MRTTRLYIGLVALGTAVLLTTWPVQLRAQQSIDAAGRYLMPAPPPANYRMRAHGNGRADAPKVQAVPGKILNLTAVPALHVAAATQHYPAIHWYALLKIPAKSEFPGTGPSGNGKPEILKSQAPWLAT